MITHGRRELERLAATCVLQDHGSKGSWEFDLWDLQGEDADLAIKAYESLLAGGVTDVIAAVLEAEGIPITDLLLDEDDSRDDITRSDLTELVAAASLIGFEGYNANYMHMPNVPKGSRRKSESGVDIFHVSLDNDESQTDLTDDDHLVLASVKHTVLNDAYSMRWKLVESLSSDLSRPYITAQLRVLNGELQKQGFTEAHAGRVYYFLRQFPKLPSVDLFAIGVVDPDTRDELIRRVQQVGEIDCARAVFRMITIPGIRTIHDRCP